MNILLCCEFYFPSVGGVQEVMRQIAERLAKYGHNVTIATTKLVDRACFFHNGVHIVEFDCHGNGAYGLKGDVIEYQNFVSNGAWDAILIKAAQQWTFDALWPVLDSIKARKVFIPCGFSGLYRPDFKSYFDEMPNILRKFDELIFYASDYRDINFARQHRINAFEVVPNGACEREFSAEINPEFRSNFGVPDSSFMFLTVGSQTGFKGHLELMQAFARLNSGNRHVTLMLNGNIPSALNSQSGLDHVDDGVRSIQMRLKQWRKQTKRKLRNWVRVTVDRSLEMFAVKLNAPQLLHFHTNPYLRWELSISKQHNKLLIRCDLDRPDLVQAYKAADLFVFASNVEYSPLVLFEAAASGTPFLTVPVGNSEEIASWLGSGIICPAIKDAQGCTRVDPNTLSEAMESCMRDSSSLKQLGANGKTAWEQHFTWARIARIYESILIGKVDGLYSDHFQSGKVFK